MGSRAVNLKPCALRAGPVAALILLALLPGCESALKVPFREPAAVSSIYTEFDPEKAFRRLGMRVEPESYGGRINTRESYGWRPRQGRVDLAAGDEGCIVVAIAIRDALNRALGEPCQSELGLDRNRDRGKPYYGMLRYVHEGRRGFVYIWLFPDEAERRVYYAVLLREELISRRALATSARSNIPARYPNRG